MTKTETITTSNIDMEEIKNAMDYMNVEVPNPLSCIKVYDVESFTKKLNVPIVSAKQPSVVSSLYGMPVKIDESIPENEVHMIARNGHVIKILKI